MDLRPLGFGEIFDRAITLYVRNFWPFMAIVLVLIVPLAVIQYVLDSSQAVQLDQMIRVLTHPGAPQPTLTSMFSSPGEIAAIAAVLLIYCALWPFVFVAVAVGVARIYSGRTVRVRCVLSQRRAPLECDLAHPTRRGRRLHRVVRGVFRRARCGRSRDGIVGAGVRRPWGHRLHRSTSGGIGFPGGTRSGVHRARVCHERRRHRKCPPDGGSGVGVRTIFTGKEFPRALLFSLAAFAVIFGGSMVISAVALLALFAHAIAVEVVVDALLRAAITPFSIVLIAVYYFDVRIRREGYDLQAEIERIASPPVVA